MVGFLDEQRREFIKEKSEILELAFFLVDSVVEIMVSYIFFLVESVFLSFFLNFSFFCWEIIKKDFKQIRFGQEKK